MWLLAAAFFLLAAPIAAFGHGPPIPIAFWGDFNAADGQCQRVIARMAATCALDVWRLSDACLHAQLNGESCDREATEAAIEAAHTSATTTANRACSRLNASLSELGYLSLVDMNIDIDVFCSELQQAMESAVYGPALHGGEIQPVDPATRSCIERTSDEATRLLQASFHSRRRRFDYIANNSFPPSRKFAAIARSTQFITRAQQRLQSRLSAACPTFAAVYPRPVVPYLTLVAERADCLTGRVYIQDFIVCPDPTCGNGMREPGERCDDGNTVSGDDCRADCQAVTP